MSSIWFHLSLSTAAQVVKSLSSLTKGDTLRGHSAMGWEGEISSSTRGFRSDIQTWPCSLYSSNKYSQEVFTFEKLLLLQNLINEQTTGREALGYVNEVVVSVLDLFHAFDPWWEGSTLKNQSKIYWMNFFCPPHLLFSFFSASFINPVIPSMCPKPFCFYWIGSKFYSAYLVIRSVTLSQTRFTYFV